MELKETDETIIQSNYPLSLKISGITIEDLINYNNKKPFKNILIKLSDDSKKLKITDKYGTCFGVVFIEPIKVVYKNVIIDNSQAFFAPPAENTYSVYSARKFIGVPDGAYVIGKEAQKYTVEYEQGFSSDTSLFLLQRIEYGCEGKAYGQRTLNEKRIDSEDIKLMSKLTRTILDGADYEFIKNKRKENFEYAAKIFEDVNRIDPTVYYDRTCVPMVYPLLCEDENLLPKLIENKHFQGHWWSYLLKEMPEDSFEYYISKYIIPVTIDQRYGKEELNFIRSLVK